MTADNACSHPSTGAAMRRRKVRIISLERVDRTTQYAKRAAYSRAEMLIATIIL
ncbi:hypothetical protein [Kocuria himachalensis]